MGIRIEKLLNQFPAVGKCKNLIGHPAFSVGCFYTNVWWLALLTKCCGRGGDYFTKHHKTIDLCYFLYSRGKQNVLPLHCTGYPSTLNYTAPGSASTMHSTAPRPSRVRCVWVPQYNAGVVRFVCPDCLTKAIDTTFLMYYIRNRMLMIPHYSTFSKFSR